MNYFLSVYSQCALKEFLLPAEENRETEILLGRNLFSLKKDVSILLENQGGSWYIREGKSVKIYYVETKQEYAGEELTNGVILTGTTEDYETLNFIVRQERNSFQVYRKYDITSLTMLTFGKGEENQIRYDYRNLISKMHGCIRKEEGQYILEDKSTNGIFVNSIRITGSRQLAFGDCIDVYGLKMVFLEKVLAVNEGIQNLAIHAEKDFKLFDIPDNITDSKENKKKALFHRSPRKIYKVETDPVEIDPPPMLREREKQSLASVIGPSLTMALPMLLGCSLAIYSTRMSDNGGSAFMYTGLVTSISSAFIGTIWALINMKNSKKRYREDELHRFEAYGEYLIKCSNQIKEKYENNTQALRAMYPSAEKCCKYDDSTPELWNRNLSHKDMMFERLGIGDIPFQVKVEIPKERFTMINDSMAEKPKMIKQSYQTLFEVPVGIDLYAHNLVGLFGGEHKEGAIQLLYNLVAQIAANNCYTDVKMAFVYDEIKYSGNAVFDFVRWLPHVWSEDKKNRYVAKNKLEASDVLYELTKIFRVRLEESNSFDGRKGVIPKPYYILFIIDPELLEGELISKYIFEEKDKCGLTSILLETDCNSLPNACNYLVRNDTEETEIYSIDGQETERVKVKLDIISKEELEKLSRRLSDIEVNEIENGGEIPGTLTFLDMYHVNRIQDLHVIERWRKNRTYESMRALIGQKTGGTDCFLDIHEKYHGPHGLVAGTTGSGKSETLQTYILSLALNFSPDDIGFFIIDYKGGGMANLFSGLPHMIGQISNLSGNQVHRAMVSIKSENQRRQKIFNEHGVNNINSYTKLYKNKEASAPVPHLFIIIDEFAELKREEPEFMRELISVAQVGRSLGVHLILATQKPSGTVDDNIWSNSKFKLCLRVQDRQDSNDMLHKPDAAYITQAGRCYLQVGNDELYELFQSGYSGASYNDSEENTKTDIAIMLSDTGKTALVGSRTKIRRRETIRQHWIEDLLALIRQAAEKIDTDIVKVLESYIFSDRLIDYIYTFIQEKGMEYQRNDYNERRLEELIHIYAQCLQRNGIRDDRKVAADVITFAEQVGRKLPERKEKTQLEAVVEYLSNVAKENGYVHNLQLWLPVLPKTLYLDELEGYDKAGYQNHQSLQMENHFELSVYIGMYDDPVNQAQKPLILDFAENGNHAICGTVMSGKSTFLQTLVYALIQKYSPQVINIYGIDYGSKMLSCFEDAPHVGGIVYEEETDRLDKLLTMLISIMQERKQLFQGGNYSQYVQVNNYELPAILVVVDNFGKLRNKTNGNYDELFFQLAKEGGNYGIFLVLSAAGFSSMEIPTRIGDNIRTSLTLEMGDKFAYADALRVMKVNLEPEENIKGRGLVRIGDSILEYQTALAVKAEDDFSRMEKIAAAAIKMKNNWDGTVAKDIPEIPENLSWEEFVKYKEVQKLMEDERHLPIGFNVKNVMPYGIDLSMNYCYLATGKTRSGKTNFLKVALLAAAAKKCEIVVIDYSNELSTIAYQTKAIYLRDDRELHQFLAADSDFIISFKKRNNQKKEMIKQGYSDEEIYLGMQEERKICIFIDDMQEFINHIYKPDLGVGAMNGTIENLLEKGTLHNVFWFGAATLEDIGQMSGNRAFSLFVRGKRGILFGGNPGGQRILDFDYVPYNQQSKSEKPGVGMLPQMEEETVRKVKLPLVVHRKA